MRRSPGAPVGELALGRDQHLAGVLLLRVLPGFDQPLGQVAAGLHQEGPGAHGHVADLEVEDFLGRT